MSVHRGHSHSLSSGITADGGGARTEAGRTVDKGESSRTFRGSTIEPARVGGGVGVAGVTQPPDAATREWERGFLDYVAAQYPQVGDAIRTSKAVGKDVEGDLKNAIAGYNKQFGVAAR